MNQPIPIINPRFRWLSLAVLVCYWTAMLLGTHWPKFQLDDFPTNTDKVLHFSGYGGLCFLMAVFVATKREVGLRDFAWIFGIAAAYSILDEITQPPFGRDCDILDAVADWIGSLIGLSAFWVVRRAFRRFAPAPRSSL